MSTFEQEIRIKLNALKEQNDKLIGSMKSLEATNEHLVVTNEKLKEDLAKTKKAFDEVFLKNIGGAWESYDEDKKKRMTLSDKAGFLTKEIHLSKIYIRDSLEKKFSKEKSELTKENKKLSYEIKELKLELSQINKNFVNDIKTKKNDIDNLMSDEENDIEQTSGGGRVKRTTGNKSAFGLEKFSQINKPRKEDAESKDNDDEKKADSKKESFMFSKSKDTKKETDSKKDSSESIDDMVSKAIKAKASKEDSSAVDNKTQESISTITNDEEEKEQSDNDFKNDEELRSIVEHNKGIELDYGVKWMNLGNPASPRDYTSAQKDIISSIQKIKLNQVELGMLKIIGEKGYFTINDVSKKISPDFISKLYPAKNKLIEYDLLVVGKELKIGGHGRPTSTFMLTDLGCWFYLFVTKRNPVDSLLKSIAKNQKSADHGFHINQIIDILTKNDYTCKQEDIKITPNGNKSICDILAKKNLKEFRIEFEEGNYSRDGYFNKYANILDVTDKLIFITYNNDVRDKLKKLFYEYINEKCGGLAKFKTTHKYHLFASMSDLQKEPDLIYQSFYNNKQTNR